MRIAAIQKKRRADPTRENSMVSKERQLRTEISFAAGLVGGNTDPVTLVTQSYKENFDAVGKARASEMAGSSKVHEKDENAGNRSKGRNDEDILNQHRRRRDFNAYRHSRRRLEESSFCDRFSEMAFRGGRLAGAVLNGEAKNMFISCVARTKNSPGPQNEKQRGIIGDSAVEKDIDSQPAKVIFNRDVKSAVGIAVDAIQGANRVLDIFRSFVKGSDDLQDDRLEMRNIQTLRQIYPFLDTRGDSAVVERYSEKIKRLENDNSPTALAERRTLEAARNKAQSVLDRKRSEQRKFLTQLDLMQSRAREAERLFKSEGFIYTVLEEAEAFLEPPNPPDDNNGGKGNKDKTRRRRSLNIFDRHKNAGAADEANSTKFTEQAGPAEQTAGQDRQES